MLGDFCNRGSLIRPVVNYYNSSAVGITCLFAQSLEWMVSDEIIFFY